MNYFEHLSANWAVAAHSLRDFFCHFIHGVLPFIEMEHYQPGQADNE